MPQVKYYDELTRHTICDDDDKATLRFGCLGQSCEISSAEHTQTIAERGTIARLDFLEQRFNIGPRLSPKSDHTIESLTITRTHPEVHHCIAVQESYLDPVLVVQDRFFNNSFRGFPRLIRRSLASG